VRTSKKWIVSLGLCAAAGAVTAFAADDDVIVTPPAPQKFDGVEVVNGGADLDEAKAIKRIAPQYPLRVEISGRGGDYYVADHVKLMQRDNVIADIPNAGPWLLVNVPAGRYTLVADFGRTELRRDVTVAGSGTTLHWVVPSSLD
jgi:hypothetical protein